jgi:hypothetical protein
MAKNVCTTVYYVYILDEVCKSVPVHLPPTSHPSSNPQTLKPSHPQTLKPKDHTDPDHTQPIGRLTPDAQNDTKPYRLSLLPASSTCSQVYHPASAAPRLRSPSWGNNGEKATMKMQPGRTTRGSSNVYHLHLYLHPHDHYHHRPFGFSRRDPCDAPSSLWSFLRGTTSFPFEKPTSVVPILFSLPRIAHRTPPDRINDAPLVFCSPDRDSFPCTVASLLPHSLLVLYECLLYGIWIGILTLWGLPITTSLCANFGAHIMNIRFISH